jgi:hypothetical protein
MVQQKTAKATLLQPGDRFLTTAEVAEFLGTTVNTLGYQRCLGTGPKFYRHGRSIRYLLSDVTAYGMRNAVEPRPARKSA